MTRTERLRYEMLVRADGFGRAHADLFPESSTGGRGFAAVAQAVADIDAERTTLLLAAKYDRAAKEARLALRAAMEEIARTAKGLDPTPDGTGQATFDMPARPSIVSLTDSARAFIQAGEARKDEFVALGLPASAFTALGEASDALDRAVRARRVSRQRVRAARGHMRDAFRRAAASLARLDIVVANALKSDQGLAGTWKRDRHIGDHKRKSDAVHVTPPDPLRKAS